MRVTTVSHNLRAWRDRLGVTQSVAAALVGMSKSAYIASELRNKRRPGNPCNKTLAMLCLHIAVQHHRSAIQDLASTEVEIAA